MALKAGLYDANGIMLCTWEESGIDVQMNLEYPDERFTNSSSIYNILTNNYPTTTKIVIPDGTTSIGQNEFYGCTNLITIYFTGTEEQWNAITFGDGWNENCPSNMQIIYNYTR